MRKTEAKTTARQSAITGADTKYLNINIIFDLDYGTGISKLPEHVSLIIRIKDFGSLRDLANALFTDEKWAWLGQEVVPLIGRPPRVGQLRAPPLPRLQVQRGPNHVEEGEPYEAQVGIVAAEPDEQPEGRWDEQGRGVVTQPSEVKGDLDAEILANRLDRLRLEELCYPRFPESLDRLRFMNGEDLRDDAFADTARKNRFALSELKVSHAVALLGLDAVHQVDDDGLTFLTAQKRLRVFDVFEVGAVSHRELFGAAAEFVFDGLGHLHVLEAGEEAAIRGRNVKCVDAFPFSPFGNVARFGREAGNFILEFSLEPEDVGLVGLGREGDDDVDVRVGRN